MEIGRDGGSFDALTARVQALEDALARLQGTGRAEAGRAEPLAHPSLQHLSTSTPPAQPPGTPGALHWEVVRFLERNDTEVQAQQPARQAVVEALAHRLRAAWPYAQLVCYGSTRTGLCTPASDIDCVVLNPPHVTSMQSAIYLLRSVFETEPCVVGTTAISHAELPILKLQVAPAPGLVFQVDVSVSSSPHHHGLTMVHVFAGEIEARPAVRCLALVLKTYLARLGLNQTFTGGLCSHALFLLARAYVVGAGVGAEGASSVDLGQARLGLYCSVCRLAACSLTEEHVQRSTC